MKLQRTTIAGIMTALAMACSTAALHAQTIITNTYTFTFGNGGATTPFNSTWIYWYNQPPGGGNISVDPTTDASNPVAGANTSGSGSLMVVSPLDETINEQDVFFGTFASNINNAYDFSVEANTAYYQSVSCDVLVAPNTPLSPNNDYGSIHVGFITSSYGDQELTASPVTIPASASSNWFHVVVPIDQTQGLGSVPGICLSFNSFGGYPRFTITNWIDNVSINGSAAPPPPPPTMLPPIKPITGLNLIDTTPAAQYDRYQIVNSNDNSGGLSFVGQSSVTYSYTIKAFPPNDPGYSYQAHFFIVSGSDNTNTETIYPDQYDVAADYNLANCIFVTIQSDGNGGGVMNFRYKTNEVQGNGMLFNTDSPTNTADNPNGWPIMPVCAMDDTNALIGTWSVTFNNTTNITLTGPGGMSTNFSMDPASAALFADPCSILLGAQPNNAGYTNQDVVYSKFSLVGTAAAYSDDFETDTELNTNYWASFGNDNNGVDLVPPGSAYWIPWTLPANSFSLYVSSTLPATNWQALSSAKVIKSGGTDEALISSNMLPQNGAKNGYFAVISNTLSQLVVILPGQTFTPGVAPGYSGTPTAISTGGNYTVEDVTVMAVDAHFNPVSGITDSILLSSATDGNAVIPPAAPMVNGAITFNDTNPFAFAPETTATPETITATDTSNTSIPAATSAPVSVGP